MTTDLRRGGRHEVTLRRHARAFRDCPASWTYVDVILAFAVGCPADYSVVPALLPGQASVLRNLRCSRRLRHTVVVVRCALLAMHLRDVIALRMSNVVVLRHTTVLLAADDESCAVLRLVDDAPRCPAVRNCGRCRAVRADCL